MLLHNGVCHPQQPYLIYMDHSYYPYHQSLPQSVAPCDEFYGMVRTPSIPSIPNHHAAMYRGYDSSPSQSFACPCPPQPPQQSFLHQILTGQGYRNNAFGLYNGAHLLESNYQQYSSSSPSSCCFGNSVRPSGFSSIQQESS